MEQAGYLLDLKTIAICIFEPHPALFGYEQLHNGQSLVKMDKKNTRNQLTIVSAESSRIKFKYFITPSPLYK